MKRNERKNIFIITWFLFLCILISLFDNINFHRYFIYDFRFNKSIIIRDSLPERIEIPDTTIDEYNTVHSGDTKARQHVE